MQTPAQQKENKMRKWMMKLAVVASLAISMCVGGWSHADEKEGTTITFDGSTTVGPIAKAFAEYMMRNHGINVTVAESGSGNGARGILNGTCDIGTLSRFMTEGEFKACAERGVMPVAHVVALDGLPIIVHPSNPIDNLTLQQVQDIYTGKIKNWKELGGPDLAIVTISRDTSSGTYETFQQVVMGKERIAEGCEYVGSNGQMRARVQATPAAIGFAGIGFLDRTIKALQINGVAPTVETVQSGEYPIARGLYFFTNGYPRMGTMLYRLVTLHLTRDGQEMIQEIGFVPVTAYE